MDYNIYSVNSVAAVRVVLRGKAHAEWKVVVSGDRRTVRDNNSYSVNSVAAVRVVLRGKAHAEWKVVVSGDRRTVRDDNSYRVNSVAAVRVVLIGKAHAEWKVVVSGDRRTVRDNNSYSVNSVAAVRVVLRGKAHAEWKVVVSGDRRTVRDDNSYSVNSVAAVRVVLRGKAHAEWKVVVSGDRRTVRDDQYFIDDRAIIWGKDKPDGNIPILPRGLHQFPFRFQLPESSLPCSFESKPGFIRYYIKVTVDIPYASPPQGMKYFTIIGPHIDCMDEQYLKPIIGQDKKTTCCLCCEKGPVVLRTQLERSAYCCGESIKLRANVDNQGEEEVRLKVRLIQYVEYFIDRGVLGVTKELQHLVLEYRGDSVKPNTRHKWDSAQSLVVPVMPPSLVGICRLMQIYYVLKVNLEFEKSGDDLHMHYPITVATVPFRIPNATQPTIHYDVACEHVEGGMYIGPEFLLGQVYDGSNAQEVRETVVLYRPVYVSVTRSHECNTT